MDNIAEYLGRAIKDVIRDALKLSVTHPKELLFLLGFWRAGNKSAKLRGRYETQGTHIPPFLIASITSRCNLFCSGCYARANGACGEKAPSEQLSAARWSELFLEARELGVSFILLAGGEPLMRPEVVEEAGKVKNITFPVFTNGTLIDDIYTHLFDKNRNLIPILSIEGEKAVTDERRGAGVYDALMDAMNQLKRKGILFGASVTVTTENIAAVTSDGFVSRLKKNGCALLFYVEYVPVDGDKPLAPEEKERAYLETRLQELRREYKMLFLSFPGDEKALGGCLAAGRGFFHINPTGGAEPCPFSPHSDCSLKDRSILEALRSPLFQKLRSEEFLLLEHAGGCALFERKEEVEALLGQTV